jgi:AcrR family transcriptional regulator
MKTQKRDRKSQRTQRLVGDALVALMFEKRYDDITIQDILDRANIGRSTFYEHYWDKRDLLTSEIERVIDLLGQRIETPPQHAGVFIPSLALFQHVREQHRLFQALLRGQSIETIIRAFQDHLQARVEEGLCRAVKKGESNELLAAVASYIVGAFISLMRWWLASEMLWSPERMDALFCDLVLPGVHHLLNQETLT